MLARGSMSAAQESRIQALRQRHSLLSSRIEEEQKRPSATDYYLKQLKKERLILKEEIEGLRTTGSA